MKKMFTKGKREINKREERKRAREAKKSAIKAANSVHAVWGWQG